MKILVLYDSAFGNTEKVARAIAETIEKGNDVLLAKPGALKNRDTVGLDLLIIGSPVQGGNALQSIRLFIRSLEPGSLKGVKLAVFDTRIDMLIAKIIGYAAPRMAKAMKSSGAQLVSPPAGFLVNDKEGPLKKDELERAKIWAKELLEKAGANKVL